MHNFFRCRRGSAAFATVVALVPLIGVVALGGEAGSWYVTKQHAQNAADAAAYSGGLRLACSNVASCTDTQSVDYRAKQFAAQNAFCNAGDTSYPGSQCVTTLPTGTSQTVQINSLTSWNGVNGNFVQAVVQQTQPAYLAHILGLSTVNIGAQAVASVVTPANVPCVLAAAGPVTFQDAAVQVNAPNCGIASNGTPIGIDFKVAPKQLNVGSLSTSGGCSGSLCGSVSPPVITYAPPVIDPFSGLKSAITSLSNVTWPPCSGLTPYTASNPCVNKLPSSQQSRSNAITQSGVYFFSDLTLTGGGNLFTCTVGNPDPGCSGVTQNVSATIILLPNPNPSKSALSMTGNSFLNITAPTTAPSASALPSQLGSVANLLANMAIFDFETSPKIGGTSTMSGSGVFYLPNANPLNYQGNSTSSISTCTEVIAASIKFSGTPNFDNSGCSDNIKLKSQVVILVQ